MPMTSPSWPPNHDKTTSSDYSQHAVNTSQSWPPTHSFQHSQTWPPNHSATISSSMSIDHLYNVSLGGKPASGIVTPSTSR